MTTLEPFTLDVAAARRVYDEQRWMHVPGGVSADLMAALTVQVADLIGSSAHEVEGWRYPDKKEQYLWDLPAGLSVERLCRAVAECTGMDPDRTVLSERHLKVYSAVAPELPAPHKDRSASQVTVGIGVDIPADSLLALWPEGDDTYNPYPSAAEWRNTRHPDELPELVTAENDPLMVDLRRGDVVMFAGACFYHERHRPASTSVLYLKFNDIGLDPLGEDPRTVAAEVRSAELEAVGIDRTHTATVSPRLIGLRADEFFPTLGSTISARTFDSEHGIRLTDAEGDLLRALAADGPTTVAPLDPEPLESLVSKGLVLIS
ncbi:MAG: hypothetical protein QNM02_02890 [Acidimicrobiia bacterium]|nr:hypothetical protein [Acidimicrobiia bacterium]